VRSEYASASGPLLVAAYIACSNGRRTLEPHAGRPGRPQSFIVRLASRRNELADVALWLQLVARKRIAMAVCGDQCDVFRNFSNCSILHYPNCPGQFGAGTGTVRQALSRRSRHLLVTGCGSEGAMIVLLFAKCLVPTELHQRSSLTVSSAFCGFATAGFRSARN